jgi:gamma-glutamyltranspeptidase/glutathione hydrolase
VDAAVAVAFVQMVIDPPMTGLGGYGTMLFRDATTGKTSYLDAPCQAGGLCTPDQWQKIAGDLLPDRFGFALDGLVNDIGYQSVGVPSIVEGLGTAHELWGTLPWGSLLADAMSLAYDGFAVTRAVHEFWTGPGLEGRASGFERMTATPASAVLFAPSGDLLEIGDRCVQRELGHTLELLAHSGYRSFYEGPVATAIVADFRANGGHLTADDLASYRASVGPPLSSLYRSWRILGTPPPAGGIMVAQMLNLLETYDLASLGHNTAASISALVDAMKYAILTRSSIGADPSFVDLDIQDLLSPRHVEAWLDNRGGRRDEITSSPSRESPTTTQVTIVDNEGSIVTLTHSLGFGSGVVTPGLGFMYNNYMNVFNPIPGHPDSVAAGKKRASSMSPTIVLDSNDEPVMALGALGATRITTAVLQCIVNILDYQLSPVEAVSAARVDCQGETVEIEGRIPQWVLDELTGLGHRVNRRDLNYDPYFARPQIVALVNGHWIGGSDPRRDGGTALYGRPLGQGAKKQTE